MHASAQRALPATPIQVTKELCGLEATLATSLCGEQATQKCAAAQHRGGAAPSMMRNWLGTENRRDRQPNPLIPPTKYTVLTTASMWPAKAHRVNWPAIHGENEIEPWEAEQPISGRRRGPRLLILVSHYAGGEAHGTLDNFVSSSLAESNNLETLESKSLHRSNHNPTRKKGLKNWCQSFPRIKPPRTEASFNQCKKRQGAQEKVDTGKEKLKIGAKGRLREQPKHRRLWVWREEPEPAAENEIEPWEAEQPFRIRRYRIPPLLGRVATGIAFRTSTVPSFDSGPAIQFSLTSFFSWNPALGSNMSICLWIVYFVTKYQSSNLETLESREERIEDSVAESPREHEIAACEVGEKDRNRTVGSDRPSPRCLIRPQGEFWHLELLGGVVFDLEGSRPDAELETNSRSKPGIFVAISALGTPIASGAW
ncbi:hypothetical protein C8R46DRAFT_1028568 [Mycena filopes]|nr:hypothetical protein C8R46DRAFT_1028568 [Mycena filopes]